ncbi:hypothetical protein HOY82DRAFT_652077 [Tuber indicum]|nr:hypothetical protein HOY82DRAFT_652077 [Tuber indicum]
MPRQVEGEEHQMNRSDEDSEDSDSEGSNHDVDERKAGYRENDQIPTSEDDGIDSDDALGSEGNRSGDEAISNEEKLSDKDDTSDVDSDLLSPNEDGGGDEGAQDREAKRWEEPKKLMTEEQQRGALDNDELLLILSQEAVNNSMCKMLDLLQGVCIKLKKAIVATNSLLRHMAAEDAALNPWNGLTDLRCGLCSLSTPEWKRGNTYASAPPLWAKVQKLEAEV